ncbi:hypothetical protein AB4Y38_03925 [Paraburkholderia sp. EG285A]|uniref:hypothetical protein n=1 Tax=Paraburkholderia sp. EG285A TaxID=3237009 RepID=UPI0034D24470
MSRLFKSAAAVYAKISVDADAARREQEALEYGAVISVQSNVYEVDGSKNWAGELTKYLCDNPKDAAKSRPEIATLVARLLSIPKFDPTRLSQPRALGAKAKTNFVIPVLKANGYRVTDINTGMDIVRSILAGRESINVIGLESQLKVEVDGISVFDPRKVRPATSRSSGFDGWTKYPYVPDPSASTELLWHRVLVQMPTRQLRLTDFLAVRGMGINEFAQLDEAASSVATRAQAAKRAGLVKATEVAVSRARANAVSNVNFRLGNF